MILNITTFNIRRDVDADGINRFSCRQEHILKAIKKYDSDMIAFQEVLPNAYEWLKETLSSKYTVVGCGRSESLSDEHMLLSFKNNKYDMLEMTTKWLSDTPDIPGSRFEKQSLCPRICTKFVLRDISESKVFSVYVTHLDHEEEYARVQGLKQIIADMESDRKKYNRPAILVGDFNEPSSTFDINEITKNFDLSLTDAAKDSGTTFHNYGDDKCTVKIDYIFTTDEFEHIDVTKWEDCDNGVYLSDHYPVSVTLSL